MFLVLFGSFRFFSVLFGSFRFFFVLFGCLGVWVFLCIPGRFSNFQCVLFFSPNSEEREDFRHRAVRDERNEIRRSFDSRRENELRRLSEREGRDFERRNDLNRRGLW